MIQIEHLKSEVEERNRLQVWITGLYGSLVCMDHWFVPVRVIERIICLEVLNCYHKEIGSL